LLISISTSAQELLRRGETYQNDTINVFIFTPDQAQQVIYWKQDSDTLEHIMYQLAIVDSINSLYEMRMEVLEAEIEDLQQIATTCSSLSIGKSLKYTGVGILVGIIAGLLIN